MRNLLLLLIIGFAAYGGYSLWNKQHEAKPPAKVAEAAPEETVPAPKNALTPTPAPTITKSEPVPREPMPGSSAPAAPAKRLAPEGVFYTIQAFSVTTDSGVRGIRAGTALRLIKDSGATVRVTDGQQEFDAQRAFLTNDLDAASNAAAQQAGQQAAAAEWQQQQKAKAAESNQQATSDAMSSMNAAQKKITLNNLTARQNALNQEAAKVQATITEYERAPRSGGIWYDVQGVRHVRVVDTHTNELVALRQKLAILQIELRNVATGISQLQ